MLRSLVILLLLCSQLCAEDPVLPMPTPAPATIKAPKEVSGTGKKVDPYVFTASTRCILELVGPTAGVKWDTEDAPTDTEILGDRYVSFSLYESGLYQITAYGGDAYSKVWFQIHSGTDPPAPVPPGPTPPGPDVVGKLWVVIVQDTAQLSQYPAKQIEALLSTRLRDYAKSHCLTGTDGKTPEYKVYDKNADVSKESPAIQKAFKTALEDMSKAGSIGPWLTTSNGKAGFSGPLPADTDATIEKLKIYGGP